jgi:2-oxoglutarate ferredoxin oxidoreductase subunit beta
MHYIQQRQAEGEVVTGLLFVDPETEDLHAHLNTGDTAFNRLGATELCPGRSALDKLNAGLR